MLPSPVKKVLESSNVPRSGGIGRRALVQVHGTRKGVGVQSPFFGTKFPVPISFLI